ncbi:MAG TPA: hypothetical protein VF384_02195 [Planctomycetota bacterium]
MTAARDDTLLALAIMQRFAERTGVFAPAGSARRYLWTDAFAVCNFLALHRATGDPEQLSAARALVQQVHEVLGRHRPDSPRSGWISGLSEVEGREHPTRGGLRIGKPMPERPPGAPMIEREEWDRDGQYFHYLTRWMHALARMAAATGETPYLDQAVDLALAAHAAFTHPGTRDGARSLHWKMSIDLGRPLVPSMSPLDPVDGLLTTMELQAAVAASRSPAEASRLDASRRDFARMEAAIDAATPDALGIGCLLSGAYAQAQLIARGSASGTGLLYRLLGCAEAGLEAFLRGRSLVLPTRHRLAFRELGLSIGLHAVEKMTALWRQLPAQPGIDHIGPSLEALCRHTAVAAAIERQWSDSCNQQEPTWTAHRDINEVMLATSLLPDGYLSV